MPGTWGETPGWGADDENNNYKYNVDEVIRIPFLQLVAGDCVNFSWRWEDGMDRKPQYWQKRNLLSVLYGGSPMFFINPDGYGSLRPLIKYTYDYVCRWNQKIANKEMLYHRSLNESRTVQESCWHDGDSRLGIVVNFGNETYRDGPLAVPPMDYRIFREGEGERVYGDPAVPARDCDYRVDDFENIAEEFERGFAYYLRSDFSPDRAQFCGVVSNAADVISGDFSMVADNSNPQIPLFGFLRSRSALVPLSKGGRYSVSFKYRVHRGGGGLICMVGNKEIWAQRSLEDGDGDAISVVFSLDSEGQEISWQLAGTGRVSIDDVKIQSVEEQEDS
jgi:hypothetical protein